MDVSMLDLTPFIPGDHALGQSNLPDKALELSKLSARLTGQLSPLSLATLEHYMGVINSYYSNLIEGNATRPHEIRAAQRGDYSDDPARRDLQQESLGHIAVQQWLCELTPDLDTVFSPDFIQSLHQRFYRQIPESLWLIKDRNGETIGKVVPGEWRTQGVKIGRHIPRALKMYRV